ncbi:MAG TPA: ABC transporter ATP-binding protein, partial [Acidimicrobiales bacterium]
MALLQVENLVTQFSMRTTSVKAVDDFSLNIEEGECVGIVGESGCGKTTAGLSIMRLLPRNGKIIGGSVIFEGQDLAKLSEKTMQGVRGEHIALIPQDPMTSLNPVQRIGQQVGEGYRIHRGASKKASLERALEVLRLVEMPNPEERLNQYPHELSGGLRQRVMIAMGLVCDPKVLIADEPTTALDVTIQAQILDILDGLREKLGMAVILITHDMGVIAGRTDRVTVMYAGKAAEEASTEVLFSKMRHPYTQALLDSVPDLTDVATDRLRSIPGLPPDLSQEIVGCRFAPRCSYAKADCLVE